MDHVQEVPATAGVGDPEVPEKAKRRRFDAAYKQRILEESGRSTGPGKLGELLRREGLYSSHLTCWRRQRDEGSLAGNVTVGARSRASRPTHFLRVVKLDFRTICFSKSIRRCLAETNAPLRAS